MDIDSGDCTYTKCYCEENVWLLCDKILKTYPEEIPFCCAVFISNKERTVPLWKQRASKREDGQVIWDYHVICIYHPPSANALVYDLDTTLTFPCDFDAYFTEGIQDDRNFKSQFQRKFRVIPAKEYLETFASDRSHMKTEDGKWMSPPPSYPIIQTSESENNIQEFISMEPNDIHGTVLDLMNFVKRFHPKSAILNI